MNFFKNIFVKKTTFSLDVKEKVKKNSEELTLTVSLLKEKNNEYLHEEKNIDFERNKFLYEIGFKKLKRVKEFINTMNKIGDIEELNRLEKKYSKYKLQVLNKEMVELVIGNYSLKTDVHSNFDGYLPNIAIDTLHINYDKLKEDSLIYSFFRKYYSSDPYKIVTEEAIYTGFVQYIKSGLEKKVEILYDSYYWKWEPKEMIVLHNNKRGLILFEITNKTYLVLSEWNDDENGKNEKMNFKEFIKNN